jgi:nucleotide-binding universal stress UspA family protein
MAPMAGRETIVVGYDGSECARRALARAAALAPDARLLVVTAVPAGGPGAPSLGEASREAVEDGERLLEECRAVVPDRALETLLGEGDPADVLVSAVEQLDATLLVVGSRGLSAVKRLLLGSTSAELARRAPCDVLVVR